MKKIYILAAALFTGTFMNAQASFSDDFESYNVGDYIGAVSPNWTTWDGITGGTEDTQVNNTMNNTSGGSKSVHYVSSSASGGPQDCVLPFGGQYNLGTFTYQMDMFVASGKGAYYNFQGESVLGNSFPFECYMRQTGAYTISNTSATLLTGTYTQNQWITIRWDINLNTNTWSYYIDNVFQGSFHNTIDQVAAIDIFAYNGGTGGNNLADYYVDNVSYTYTPYTLPSVNAGTTALGVLNPATRTPVNVTGLVGQTRPMAVTVRNLGTTALTSFDLELNYNSQAQNMSVTGANIASLAEQTYTFSMPVTLVAGNLPVYAVVSNVNGAGADMDNTDDTTRANANITTVPAPGKMVLGEEATGTWCPWCVRGTVFMDYMSNDFSGFWAGVAVHNNDPMTIQPYDSIMGTHVTSYPSVLVDRGAAIDPSAIEASFLSRIVIAPSAIITNGAQLAGNQLDVSLTYTFNTTLNNSANNYKVACILTQDSVTGTGSSWSQNNAYAGGSNGPMGGFESLPNPVSYTVISYNHVARALSPGWNGEGGLPASITASYSQSFNFSFTVPGTWNTNKMHIIGILIAPNGIVDNASETTIAEAITNGYQAGTGVGISQIITDQPDDMSLYPNPSADGITYANIDLKSEQNVTLTVTDLAGNVVASRDYGMLNGTYQLPINTVNFASGVYLVTVKTGSSVTTQKLIVQ